LTGWVVTAGPTGRLLDLLGKDAGSRPHLEETWIRRIAFETRALFDNEISRRYIGSGRAEVSLLRASPLPKRGFIW